MTQGMIPDSRCTKLLRGLEQAYFLIKRQIDCAQTRYLQI